MKASEWMWILHEGGRFPDNLALDRLERALERVLDVLEAHSELRIALFLSGSTLEWLGTRGNVLKRAAAQMSRRRLELLGGGFTSPILAGIPEADAMAQIRHTAQQLREHTTKDCAGVWLEPSVWDPSLCPILARLGIRYTFLSLEQIAFGLPRQRDEGPWAVERLGFMVSVFGVDRQLGLLSQAGDINALFDILTRREKGEGRLFVSSEPLIVFSEQQEAERLEKIAKRLEEDAYRLKTVLPEQAFAARRCRTLLALPASLPPPMASLIDDETGRGFGLKGAEEGFLRPTWEFLLVRYPEANHLHKKMLLASTRIQKMSSIVRKRHARGEDVATLAQALERARRALFKAQGHCAYWPVGGLGLHDSKVRAAAHRSLMEVMRITGAVFYPEGRYVSIERIDLDRDGCEEILVETPRSQAIFSLKGGSLLDFSCKSSGLALTDLFGRRPERIHEHLRHAGVSVPVRRSKSARPLPNAEVARELEPHIRYDRYLRRTFLDHFLGALANPHNFYQCQYPEIGDFIDGHYEIISSRYERRKGVGRIRLSRNGMVAEPGMAQAASIRIEKTFEFEDDGAQLRVLYTLRNRGQSPATFRFGIEIGLCAELDMAAPADTEPCDKDAVLASKGEKDSSLDSGYSKQNGENHPSLDPKEGGENPSSNSKQNSENPSLDAAQNEEKLVDKSGSASLTHSTNREVSRTKPLGEVFKASSLTFYHKEDELTLKLSLNEEATWWTFMQETVNAVDGEAKLLRQGRIFMPWWDVSLWGDESRTFEILVQLHEEDEEPLVLIDEP